MSAVMARGLKHLTIRCSFARKEAALARDMLKKLSTRRMKAEYPEFKVEYDWDVPESLPLSFTATFPDGSVRDFNQQNYDMRQLVHILESHILFHEDTENRTQLLKKNPGIWWRYTRLNYS